MVYWTSPDSYLEALDARTGEMRWEAKTETRGATQGAVIAGDKVISGGACGGKHENCFIDAHDAKTGKLLWKFMTAAETGQPGGDSWGGLADDKRVAGPWGLSGTYDPSTNSVIWGIANPTPNTRLERHNGDFNAIPTHAPADLFSNSTVSLNADTGKLNWYYQHLPGDDWDEDWTNDRILITTTLNPTPATAKWFNKKIKPGERRDIVLATGESGGVFALDRHTGEFLWANPWPYDVPNFFLKNIDENGITYLNESAMLTHPNMTNTVCFFNTRSYWSQGYSPITNSLYVPFVDACNEEKDRRPRHALHPQRRRARPLEARRALRCFKDQRLHRKDRSHLQGTRTHQRGHSAHCRQSGHLRRSGAAPSRARSGEPARSCGMRSCPARLRIRPSPMPSTDVNTWRCTPATVS